MIRYLTLIILIITLSTEALPTIAQEDAGGCSSPLDLVPGQRINTRPGINIRNQPTLSGGIVNYLDSSITYRVEGGPVCADGVNWWQVRGPINFNPGWVAEKEFPEGRYLIFALPLELDSECSEPLNLVAGSQMPLLNGVKIRQEANLNGLVLTVAPAGEVVTVVGGPECNEDINWWLVQVPFEGIIIQGWMAQGYPERDFVSDPDAIPPDQICGPSLPLDVGDRAAVNVADFKPKNLRTTPGVYSPLLFTLIEGVAFDIIAGPVCASNLNWWQVRIVARPDVVGWISEGGPGNYAIRRFTQDRIPGQ